MAGRKEVNYFGNFYIIGDLSPSLIGTVVCLILIILIKLKFIKLNLPIPYLMFPFLTLIAGPGIFVNLIGKEMWGRPRPNCIELGGTKKFQSVLEINPKEKDKSFPLWTCRIRISLVYHRTSIQGQMETFIHLPFFNLGNVGKFRANFTRWAFPQRCNRFFIHCYPGCSRFYPPVSRKQIIS